MLGQVLGIEWLITVNVLEIPTTASGSEARYG